MKPWREAASVILCARHKRNFDKTLPTTAFQYDYKLLTMKRHENASFLPDNYVFPGGNVEPSDADLKWKELYKKFGFDNDSFTSLFPKTKSRPGIFKQKNNELPREISLRITAIRETFEECGILICRNSRKKGVLAEWAENYSGNNTHEMMMKWQKRIHNDATEFYRMCEGLKCYPDLWVLHEYSNWLTPIIRPKRFDTVFFMACMEAQPDAYYDPSEMQDLRWDHPQALLRPGNGIILPPPQHYEIARIGKFESLDNLLDFVVDRSKIGSHLIMPVRVKLSNGIVFLLPGDSVYPPDVSLTEKFELDRSNMTISDFRNLATVKNRLEFYELEVKRVVSENFESKDGHLSPMALESISIKSSKSKFYSAQTIRCLDEN